MGLSAKVGLLGVLVALFAAMSLVEHVDVRAQDTGGEGGVDGGLDEAKASEGGSKASVFAKSDIGGRETRWRIVDDVMGPTALGSIAKDDVAVWNAPYAKGHMAVGTESAWRIKSVYGVVDESLYADPLWNLRSIEAEGRRPTDAASWGKREAFRIGFDPSSASFRDDSFAWFEVTSGRAQDANVGESVAWDVPHSPFVMDVMHNEDVALMLRYRREYKDTAWEYWTEVVSANDGQSLEGAPLAKIPGLADAPAVWGPYLLLRRYTGSGDESEMVMLSTESRREPGADSFATRGALHGPFPVDLKAGGPTVYSRPTWLMVREQWNPRRALPGRVPSFAVVASKGGVSELLQVLLDMQAVESAISSNTEGVEPGAVVYGKPSGAEVEVLPNAIGNGAVISPIADTLAFQPDTVRTPGGVVNAREVEAIGQAYQREHAAWKQAVTDGQEAGDEPINPLDGVAGLSELGATLALLRKSSKLPGMNEIVQIRLRYQSRHGNHAANASRQDRSSHFEFEHVPATESTPATVQHNVTQPMPIAGFWPTPRAVGKPEFEALAAGRVWRVLPDGRVGVHAAIQGDLPSAIPQPDRDTPMRPIGAQHLGHGFTMIWWARGPKPPIADKKSGDGNRNAGEGKASVAAVFPSVDSVEAFAGKEAPASNKAFAFTMFSDTDLGMLWPNGAPSEVFRTTNTVAAKSRVASDWVAENVLMAKRSIAARKAGRLKNTVLIYGFDVKVQSDQIKNAKGDVVEVYAEFGRAKRAMLRMEDDFAGEWTVKAWQSGVGGTTNDTAFIADDKDRKFTQSRGNTVSDLASMARARKLLIQSDADSEGVLKFVRLRRGFPVDPESGKAWNTYHFIRESEDGSFAHLYFDADGKDHELVLAQLSFPIAAKSDEETGGHSSIDLWLSDYTDLADLGAEGGAFGKKAEALRVPKSVRAFTPGSSELRFAATFKPEIRRTTNVSGAVAIRSGFNWDRVGQHHFRSAYAWDANSD